MAKNKILDELIIANKELAFQNKEKEKRAAELILANKELAFQNKEKEKRTEELARSKQLLDEAGRLARIGGWEFDLKNNKLSWSDVVYQIHEIEPDYQPTVESGINFYAPESIPVISEAVSQAIEEGKSFDLDLQLITAKQNRIWVRAIGHAYRVNSEIVKIGGVFQDINERKQAEEELILAYKELAFQNEEKEKHTAELINTNKELEQFAYIASHDLQEPLRMVASYTQLLERRYKDKLDQDANDFIQYAVDGANRMQKLINDLLDYSRTTSRGRDFTKVDISQVLGQAISNLQRLIIENNALITNEDLPELIADESQIMRVFQNLIENAMKFKIKSELPKIHISCKKRNRFYEFAVSDNGIGIDMQFHDRVFTIFQRLHSKEEYPGTGIGLSICKRIIERHGGKIWFESKENEGTTFYFTLKI